MFKIAVMGCGVVGSGVCDILLAKQEELSARFQREVKLSYIVDVRKMPDTPYEKFLTDKAEDVFNDPEVRLIVVTIGGLEYPYLLSKRALSAGINVVTSNKEVVAAYAKELSRIAFENKCRFLYEASSGGGIPIIRPLNICLSSNDILEIQGILNGTTNYILTKMSSKGLSFDTVLKEAQQKGYAEANPAADVDGFDAARKIAILSSIAYKGFVEYNDVKCTGIRDVKAEDHANAAKLGYVIKLIAGSKLLPDGSVTATVEPKLVPKDNILAAVNSVYNAVLVKGSYTGDSLFYGKGAGKLATASAVCGDIIEILGRPTEDTLMPYVEKDLKVSNDTDIPCRFYLRFDITRAIEDSVSIAMREIFGPETLFAAFGGVLGMITPPIKESAVEGLTRAFEAATDTDFGCSMRVLE